MDHHQRSVDIGQILSQLPQHERQSLFDGLVHHDLARAAEALSEMETARAVALLSTLDRDGTGDFDADGKNDLQEYVTGTDPTNNGSVFRVLTLTGINTGGTRLVWSAVPGKTYRAEYKADLNATWTPLPELVTASSSTASLTDSTAIGSEKRFYRVVLVE